MRGVSNDIIDKAGILDNRLGIEMEDIPKRFTDFGHLQELDFRHGCE